MLRRCACTGGPIRNCATGGVDNLDDFAACKFTRKEDWIDLFVTPYYFGCEADDRMNATAFLKLNPFDAQLNAIYSSDIGHFDVIDMREPLPEAYELVEDGYISQDNFRDFVFTNAVKLWGTQNPDFFKGTPRREGSRCGPQRRPTAGLRRRSEVGSAQTPSPSMSGGGDEQHEVGTAGVTPAQAKLCSAGRRPAVPNPDQQAKFRPSPA